MKRLLCTGIMAGLLAFAPPTTRIEFNAPELYPEGVVWNPEQKAYFVSSARTGNIGKVTPEGNYSVFYQEGENLKSSYGLKISPDRKKLYACISDANYSKFKTDATHKKMIRLIAIDIKSGKKTMDVDLSNLINGEHFGNDLTLDNSGNAYVTDSFSNVIYKVTPDGKASLFAQSQMFKTAGVGLNGIAWNKNGYLLVANGGTGSLYKVDIKNPQNIQKVKTGQFFMNADGLLFTDPNTLVLVQNGGSNRVYKLRSDDNWASAGMTGATSVEDFFSYPSTATQRDNEVWIMNAKFNELADSTAVPSKKFSIQKAVFKP